MTGVNRGMNRYIRKVFYTLKRQYGGRVHVYKLLNTNTDYKSGEKTFSRTMHTVHRCIVLPAKLQREAIQTISHISANKMFVVGGSYDAGTRLFVIDSRDMPAGYEFAQDDWLVYNNRRYEIKDITEFEQHSGWVITGREVRGSRPEQVIEATAVSWLGVQDKGEPS